VALEHIYIYIYIYIIKKLKKIAINFPPKKEKGIKRKKTFDVRAMSRNIFLFLHQPVKKTKNKQMDG
jgi:hypothetical protein